MIFFESTRLCSLFKGENQEDFSYKGCIAVRTLFFRGVTGELRSVVQGAAEVRPGNIEESSFFKGHFPLEKCSPRMMIPRYFGV